MTKWLTGQTEDATPGARLAELWRGPEILRLPGAHDALSGLLAQRAGFDALYISGAALTASRGLPDLGILSMDELCDSVGAITRATGLPVIADGDTGYGEALNVMRLVRQLESAGAAAVQIEDQPLPKKCGHLSDKKLVSTPEMCAKIAAARKARRDLRIIARTDAFADEGMSGALARAKAYVRAGADAIFPEALQTEADFRTFAQELDVPLLANMTEFGRTPYFSAEEFQAFGFKMVIWPVSSLRVAAKAIEGLYAHIRATGGTKGYLDHMQSRAELYDVIGYHDYEALDQSIAASSLPES